MKRRFVIDTKPDPRVKFEVAFKFYFARVLLRLKMNSDSEVEFDSSDEDLSNNLKHSKRPFTRPFVHLKKRLQGAPCKSKYDALKAAGRVRDLCFTKRYSNADIEGMLKSNFPSLTGLDLTK